MIEPSSGRTTTSGPGAPLLVGIGATAALVIVFLIGFQLGSGQQRVQTVIVGASQAAKTSEEPRSISELGGRIQPARVDEELQQAYYASLRQGAWVVCTDDTGLNCHAAKYEVVDGSRGFQPPETYVADLELATVSGAGKVYLVGDLEQVWIGAVDGPKPHGWDRLLGVTLNGSVQFLDLGDLAPGRYVMMDRLANAFNQQGPVTRALAITVLPGA